MDNGYNINSWSRALGFPNGAAGTPQRMTERRFIDPTMTESVTGTEVWEQAVLLYGHSLGTSLSFPRWRMALFSRSSICPLLGLTRLFSIALTTVTTGTECPLAQDSGREPKNFLIIHSPGRDSCLSHSRTLGDREKGRGRDGTCAQTLRILHIEFCSPTPVGRSPNLKGNCMCRWPLRR